MAIRCAPILCLVALRVTMAPAPACAEPVRSLEVAFAIDATGSMSGFLEGAKRKVWAIARQVAQPGVKLRLGLVAYRDRGDAFVTRVVPLAADLDSFDHALHAVDAGGGGDTPEAVNRALAEAVTQLGWSAGSGASRWLFLVGDAPPHDHEAQEVPYAESVARARRQGIVIHAIQCGSAEDTERVWREIARLSGGHYVALDPGTALARIETRFDAELARAGRELAETIVPTGDAEARRALRDRRSQVLAADAASAAERLGFLERRGRSLGEGWGDLVSRAARGELGPADVAASDWPDALRDAAPEARAQWLADQVERRRGLWSEIAWLARRRAERLRVVEAQRREAGESERFESLLQRLMDETGG